MISTLGARLIALKERSGMSLAEVARAGGYQGASSIQKLFKADYNPPVLDKRVAERLASAFVGRGDPRIEASEISALTGSGETIDLLLADLKHYNYLASAAIGLHRTKRIDQCVTTDEGVEIPLFVREDMSGGIPYHPCPSYLRSRGVVGLYVTVGNMWPRFEEGEPIFYEHTKPPVRGDDVIVTVARDGDLDGGMILGRLRELRDDEVQIDVLNPAGRVVIPRNPGTAIRRVMHTSDLFEPLAYASGG